MKASIQDEGTIVLFKPRDTEAEAWIDEFVDPDAQWWCGALAIEHRYADALIDGFINDGGEITDE